MSHQQALDRLRALEAAHRAAGLLFPNPEARAAYLTRCVAVIKHR